MIEQKVLEDLGLSNKEASIYLAILELGSGSVVEVSKKSGVKRPTTYLILEELKKRGLVTESLESSRSFYTAEDPLILAQSLKHKLEDFNELLPVMRAKYNRGVKPKIRYIEGKESLYNMYFREVFPSETVYFYGTSVGKIMDIWPTIFDDYKKYWHPEKKKDPSKILEIVSNGKRDVQYAKEVTSERKIRILPSGMKFLADNAVTLDKVYIVSLDNLFAVVIESEDIAFSYRTLVELAWQSSIPVNEWKD